MNSLPKKVKATFHMKFASTKIRTKKNISIPSPVMKNMCCPSGCGPQLCCSPYLAFDSGKLDNASLIQRNAWDIPCMTSIRFKCKFISNLNLVCVRCVRSQSNQISGHKIGPSHSDWITCGRFRVSLCWGINLVSPRPAAVNPDGHKSYEASLYIAEVSPCWSGHSRRPCWDHPSLRSCGSCADAANLAEQVWAGPNQLESSLSAAPKKRQSS